jgi:hypothetical protein
MVKLPTEITMSKQTAVDWLMKEFYGELQYVPITRLDRVKDIFQRAKEMEKEQIMDAFNEGIDWHRDYFGKQKGMVKILPDTYGDNNE